MNGPKGMEKVRETLAGLGEKADTQMPGVAMARGRKWIWTGHDLNHQWEGGPMAKVLGNTKRRVQVRTASKCLKWRESSKAKGTSQWKPLWHWQRRNAALSLAFLWIPRLKCSPRESTHTPESLEVGWDLTVRCASTWLNGTQLEDSPAARGPRAKGNMVTAPLPPSNPGKTGCPWRRLLRGLGFSSLLLTLCFSFERRWLGTILLTKIVLAVTHSKNVTGMGSNLMKYF